MVDQSGQLRGDDLGNDSVVDTSVAMPIIPRQNNIYAALNEEIAGHTGISDEDIVTQIIDYGHDYPNGISKSYGQVSYAELKSGSIKLNGQEVPTVPLSSLVKAREIAEILKKKISKGKFNLGEPQFTLPSK